MLEIELFCHVNCVLCQVLFGGRQRQISALGRQPKPTGSGIQRIICFNYCKIFAKSAYGKLYYDIAVFIRLSRECPGYNTEPHLVVRFQSWRSGQYGEPLHRHYYLVHSSSVPSMSQITHIRLDCAQKKKNRTLDRTVCKKTHPIAPCAKKIDRSMSKKFN